MPWSGGSFSRTNGVNTGSTTWQQDEAGAVDIEADRHDTHDQDLADGIDACLAKDGSNAMTANLDLGGYAFDNASASVNFTKTDAVDLSDANNALSIGGATSSAHLAMSAAIIQAKSDATTAAPLAINSLGGNLNLGPQSGSGAVSLYTSGNKTFGGTTYSGAGEISGAEVADGGGTLRPVGFNVMPVEAVSAGVTLNDNRAGWMMRCTSAVSVTADAAASDLVPNGTKWTVVNESGGNVTLAFSSVTGTWLDGSGGSTGNRTLADGGIAHVVKRATGQYLVWGTGLS